MKELIEHTQDCRIHKADPLAGLTNTDCDCGALDLHRAKWYLDRKGGMVSPREAQQRIDEYERQMEIDIEADHVSRLAAQKIMNDMRRRNVWWRRLGNGIIRVVWRVHRFLQPQA